jgi:F420-non-reducing hydrogenase iron-sulfur subunit
MSDFEPKILGFLCNWCSYAGADLAGVSRYQYPPNIRIVRVMCSTRVSPHIILEVFKAGADGVMVGGCHIGDCHYITGNYYTERRVKLTKELLALAGIEPDRLRLEWVSASEGEKFANVVADFVKQIKEIGPSPIKNNQEMMTRLSAAIQAAKIFRVKLVSGKELKLTTEGNVYGEKIDQERMDAILKSVAQAEFKRSLILELTKQKALSVKELADAIGETPDTILDHIVVLRSKNLIALSGIEGSSPKYKAILVGGV